MRFQIHILAPGEGQKALRLAQHAEDQLTSLHRHPDIRVWSPAPGKFGIAYETDSLADAQAFLVRANAQLIEL